MSEFSRLLNYYYRDVLLRWKYRSLKWSFQEEALMRWSYEVSLFLFTRSHVTQKYNTRTFFIRNSKLFLIISKQENILIWSWTYKHTLRWLTACSIKRPGVNFSKKSPLNDQVHLRKNQLSWFIYVLAYCLY